MSHKKPKLLFVFSHYEDDELAVYSQLTKFQRTLKRQQSLKREHPECYILYVCPQVPSYAMQTPQMINLAIKERAQGLQLLRQLGKALHIRPEQQLLSQGNSDMQAWRFARELKIDKVLGYSKTFIAAQKCWKVLHHAWGQIPYTMHRLVKWHA